MVWARTKLMILDELLKPRNRMEVNFAGINPEKFYHTIPKLLMSAFRVDERQLQERKFSWSHGDPQKFRVVWELNKELDFFSYYTISVELEGSSSKGVGNANMFIEGFLKTEYPQDTLWHRSLVYEMIRMFWHKTFYISKREQYVIEGRRLIALFVDDLKKIVRG